MSEAEANKLAAELLAGELSPADEQALRARIAAEPAAQAALGRMQATISAMQAWPASLPRVAVPVKRRLPARQWLRLAPLVAAAVAFLVFPIWVVLHTEQQQPRDQQPGGDILAGGRLPVAASDWAERDFAFLLLKPKPGDPYRGGKEDGGKFGGGPPTSKGKEDGSEGGAGNPPKGKGDGGTIGGPPGGGIKTGGPSGQGGKGGANPFRKLVDFDFELPEELPGNFRLKEGKAEPKNVLRLTYTAGPRQLVVHLKKSTGPDAPVEPLARGRLLAARRDHLAIAVEGADLNFPLIDAMVKLFVPAPREADPGLE